MIVHNTYVTCYADEMKFIISFFILIFISSAHAFINVESVRQIQGKGFIGRSALQTSGQQGNTDKFTSAFTTIGAYRLDHNEWLYSGNYKYGTSAKVKDTNLGIAHLRHTWNYQKPLAYEMFAQSEFNEFKDLNSRHFLGGNFRFRLKQTETYFIYSGVGTFYEWEDFGDNTKDRNHFRGNIYLSYVQNLKKNISAFGTLYYQPLLSNTGNHRLRFQSGVDIKLTNILSVGISFNVNHDTGVPKGVKYTDIDYLVGFGVTYF